MTWGKSPIVGETGVDPNPREPQWLINQLWELFTLKRSRLSSRQREVVNQADQDACDRWAKIKLDIELSPIPDLHLLRHAGHSPNGTLLPRYLVRRLQTLRDEAGKKSDDYEDEEYEKAKEKRVEALVRWRERYPDIILADDPVSIYKTWPPDLMNELDEIDREVI
jgi:hypothetical protein